MVGCFFFISLGSFFFSPPNEQSNSKLIRDLRAVDVRSERSAVVGWWLVVGGVMVGWVSGRLVHRSRARGAFSPFSGETEGTGYAARLHSGGQGKAKARQQDRTRTSRRTLGQHREAREYAT